MIIFAYQGSAVQWMHREVQMGRASLIQGFTQMLYNILQLFQSGTLNISIILG